MISNGQKVIGIEENGYVKNGRMSSCPVSPSTPKFDGSARKTIGKETQEAIKQFLLSNHSPFAVTAQHTPTLALDADFLKILQEKRNEQLEAARHRFLDKSINRDFMVNANANETKYEGHGSTLSEDGIADGLKSCIAGDKDDKPNAVSLNENSFLALFSS